MHICIHHSNLFLFIFKSIFGYSITFYHKYFIKLTSIILGTSWFGLASFRIHETWTGHITFWNKHSNTHRNNLSFRKQTTRGTTNLPQLTTFVFFIQKRFVSHFRKTKCIHCFESCDIYHFCNDYHVICLFNYSNISIVDWVFTCLVSNGMRMFDRRIGKVLKLVFLRFLQLSFWFGSLWV